MSCSEYPNPLIFDYVSVSGCKSWTLFIDTRSAQIVTWVLWKYDVELNIKSDIKFYLNPHWCTQQVHSTQSLMWHWTCYGFAELRKQSPHFRLWVIIVFRNPIFCKLYLELNWSQRFLVFRGKLYSKETRFLAECFHWDQKM